MTMIWGYYSSVVVCICILKLMITSSIINKKELLVHEFIPLLPTYMYWKKNLVVKNGKLVGMTLLEGKFKRCFVLGLVTLSLVLVGDLRYHFLICCGKSLQVKGALLLGCC